MTSFGWKRRVGEKVSRAAAQTFEAAAAAVGEDGAVESDVDWLHVTKRRRETLQEDCAAKSKRLKDEGAFFSENGRYWEAIGRWDEAIQLTPDCAALYEMKAQAVRTFQQAVHAFPGEKSLWDEDLCWAVELRRRQRDLAEVEVEVETPAPELPDYDFESDELVAACAAIADRERDARRAAAPIFVRVPGGGEEGKEGEEGEEDPQQSGGFIQAR
ncbi:tetratricopeptide repeat protein 33 isoform X2 [Amblyraja radiata]|uniref:tetratricopeptide repeat protein 33 isoform X2 n=1 Tax=Amblyraja radiata TaxID=386614 RepID=UPI001403EDA0|nr:tetratricopeptide repeat protein 33 isoform X2 [Amblyraja radiata]